MNTSIDDHLIYARAIVRSAIEGLNQNDGVGPHSERLVSLLNALTHEVHQVIQLSDDNSSSTSQTTH